MDNKRQKVKFEKIQIEDKFKFRDEHMLTLDFELEATKILNETNEIVGFIDYRVTAQTNDVYIEFFEIKINYRNQGYAKYSLEELRNMHPEKNIFGQSIPDEKTKAIWESLGAEFLDCEEAECPYESYDDCTCHCGTPASYSFGFNKLI